MHKIYFFILIFFSVIAFGASWYSVYEYVHSIIAPGTLTCDVNQVVNCTKTITSDYNKIFGIPLGFWGSLYAFVSMVLGSFFWAATNIKEKKLYFNLWLFQNAVGAIVVCILMYISYDVLDTICIVCSCVHISILLSAVLLLLYWFGGASQNTEASIQTGITNNTSISMTPILIKLICLGGLLNIGLGLATDPLLNIATASKRKQEADALAAQNKQAEMQFLGQHLMPITNATIVQEVQTPTAFDYGDYNKNAMLQVVVFFDFGCPHCWENEMLLSNLQKSMGDSVLSIRYKHFPLQNECNPLMHGPGWYKYNCVLARASQCAGQQNLFMPFKDWAFSFMPGPQANRDASFTTAAISQAFGSVMGGNTAQFDACMANPQVLNQQIVADANMGQDLHLEGTPVIVINNYIYQLSDKLDDLTKTIQALVDISTKQ
jgi:uncharacterized membrane protein/protein-disulfide isomerase